MSPIVPWRSEDLKTWRSERRKTIRKLKKDKGCAHCKGFFPHYGLDFHHIESDDKSFSISQNLYCRWDTLVKELTKCVILCKICHSGVTCGEIILSLTLPRAWTYRNHPWKRD